MRDRRHRTRPHRLEREGRGDRLLGLARGAGKAVATAALTLISEWAFQDLSFERLELFTDPNNGASRRLAERCGFSAEGLLRSHTCARWRTQGLDGLRVAPW